MWSIPSDGLLKLRLLTQEDYIHETARHWVKSGPAFYIPPNYPHNKKTCPVCVLIDSYAHENKQSTIDYVDNVIWNMTQKPVRKELMH